MHLTQCPAHRRHSIHIELNAITADEGPSFQPQSDLASHPALTLATTLLSGWFELLRPFGRHLLRDCPQIPQFGVLVPVLQGLILPFSLLSQCLIPDSIHLVAGVGNTKTHSSIAPREKPQSDLQLAPAMLLMFRTPWLPIPSQIMERTGILGSGSPTAQQASRLHHSSSLCNQPTTGLLPRLTLSQYLYLPGVFLHRESQLRPVLQIPDSLELGIYFIQILLLFSTQHLTTACIWVLGSWREERKQKVEVQAWVGPTQCFPQAQAKTQDQEQIEFCALLVGM